MLTRVVAWVGSLRLPRWLRPPREVKLAHRKRALERDLRARGYSLSEAKQAAAALGHKED